MNPEPWPQAHSPLQAEGVAGQVIVERHVPPSQPPASRCVTADPQRKVNALRVLEPPAVEAQRR